jgi:hypothetical protein
MSAVIAAADDIDPIPSEALDAVACGVVVELLLEQAAAATNGTSADSAAIRIHRYMV